MKNIAIIVVIAYVLLYNIAFAGDIFGDYKKDISSDAKAHATEVYSAWGENMAHHIEHGIKKGIVITGEMDTPEISADGLGNVTVKKGANVGAVINKVDASHSTIIIQDGKGKTTPLSRAPF